MSSPDPKVSDRSLQGDRLNGWKEISNYLGKSVRTAQRWEGALGLPVHRIRTPRGEIIFASKQELDRWQLMKERDSRRSFPLGEDQVSLARLALLPESEFDRVLRSGVSNAARAELLCQACLALHTKGQPALDNRRARALLERLARSADATIASRARSVLHRLQRSEQP